ncbi:hypothetical protein D918_09764 [Trichuris suis]|nr:hypothetical protein D918_09764 [Trichuris suis]
MTSRWDEPIDDYLIEVVNAMKNQDPARGHWKVSGDKAKLWVDVSSMTMGVVVEANGGIDEDAAWLRPDDPRHITLI